MHLFGLNEFNNLFGLTNKERKGEGYDIGQASTTLSKLDLALGQ